MNLRDEMKAALTDRCHERCSTCRDAAEVCAEVAERHLDACIAEKYDALTSLRRQADALLVEKDTRIAELEAERDSWRRQALAGLRAWHLRDDDGRVWRVEHVFTNAVGLTSAELVPVEDTDE